MIKKENNLFSKLALIILSVFLIILGALLFYSHTQRVNKVNKLDNDSLNAYFEKVENNKANEIDIKHTHSKIINYIAVLEIPKINLKHGIPYPSSEDNNVDRNIMIIPDSSLPDEESGLMILASHSGNSSISYFKNLYKLNQGDTIKIYYNNDIYQYEINNIYEIEKRGTLDVQRNASKKTVILITCTKNNNGTQTVYVAYEK